MKKNVILIYDVYINRHLWEIPMIRIVIDLPEEDLRQLDNLKAIRHVARAEIIRQAVADYLEKNRADGSSNAFGLW
ncbi:MULTISPECIES: CopG family transcriptional regulator [Symbiopectobacterium]|uniref:ribbon-helix-helix domain-containing protein n=1 Tax=Symbiopectobacterium TaxID=801 RepID=UPI0020795232|nr:MULTISPECIES: ribbon-helix-helix protein, CopG family [Symbiopectobacterium]